MNRPRLSAAIILILLSSSKLLGQGVWEPSYDGIEGADSSFVTALFASPHGDVLAGIIANRGIQIARTTDDGVSWQIICDSLPHEVTALYTTPSGDIFAATRASWAWELGGSIYHSGDDGRSWQLLSDRIDGSITAFTVDRRGILYAGLTQNVGYFGSVSGSLYRSLNGGWTWEKMWVSRSYGVTRIVEGQDGAMFLACSLHNDGCWSQGGVHRSTDQGVIWTALIEGPQISMPDYVGSDLEVDHHGRLFASGHTNSTSCCNRHSSVYCSTNAGETWMEHFVADDTMSSCGVSIKLTVDSNDNIYAAHRGRGIYRCTDACENWTPWNEGMETRLVTTIVTSARGTVFAGTYQNGIYRSPQPLRQGETRTYQFPTVEHLTLGECTPNPAFDGATLTFALPVDCEVSLSLMNLIGSKVATLVDGWRSAGTYSVRIDAAAIPSGTYLCALRANGGTASTLLTILH
jgi:photosystem II stability/assembly factor-like uncharacterized protein